ncbi:MAG TPA: TM2 domain-containing protein [Bacteroidia bacterium]|jgi:TM2 domain-containing membrane protein YozV|nr:TM2 domain-containing protein [Bacteroidia bacterium]
MRKSLCFFVWAIFFVFASVHSSAMDADTSRKLHKERKLERVKIKRDSTKLAEADTIKLNPVGFHKKHRLVAALLAFPLGVFGLHRMYLHTSAKVPIIYIVTLGGGLGVLPFIDFVLILLNKDIHTNYTSNPHLFMWEKRGRITDTVQHTK